MIIITKYKTQGMQEIIVNVYKELLVSKLIVPKIIEIIIEAKKIRLSVFILF